MVKLGCVKKTNSLTLFKGGLQGSVIRAFAAFLYTHLAIVDIVDTFCSRDKMKKIEKIQSPTVCTHSL